jgi:hypothetical protein
MSRYVLGATAKISIQCTKSYLQYFDVEVKLFIISQYHRTSHTRTYTLSITCVHFHRHLLPLASFNTSKPARSSRPPVLLHFCSFTVNPHYNTMLLSLGNVLPRSSILCHVPHNISRKSTLSIHRILCTGSTLASNSRFHHSLTAPPLRCASATALCTKTMSALSHARKQCISLTNTLTPKYCSFISYPQSHSIHVNTSRSVRSTSVQVRGFGSTGTPRLLDGAELNAAVQTAMAELNESRSVLTQTQTNLLECIEPLVKHLEKSPDNFGSTGYSAGLLNSLAEWMVMYNSRRSIAFGFKDRESKDAETWVMNLAWRMLHCIPDDIRLADRQMQLLLLHIATRLRNIEAMLALLHGILRHGRNMTENEMLVAFLNAPIVGKWRIARVLGDRLFRGPDGQAKLDVRILQF